ncbi:hypothetical protein FHU41_000454 [Psychromicrobium silvestre]|uniref:Uncharacterized protein n=1 Tax=Psychromicrobium silvestre TaxID=1645614 RepID=A0A7Y9S449_9MICC|nr:hypothetical protein [Psychromicrobium silvestre]NYE94233.1 hypothetical protein [Psychromicrobium silvestre]
MTEKDMIGRIINSIFYVDDVIRIGDKVPYDLQVAHGYFRLNYIDSESFEIFDARISWDELIVWFSMYGPLPENLSNRLEQLKSQVFKPKHRCYRLINPDRDESEHSYGSSIGESGFYEYMIFNPEQEEVWVVTCTED